MIRMKISTLETRKLVTNKTFQDSYEGAILSKKNAANPSCSRFKCGPRDIAPFAHTEPYKINYNPRNPCNWPAIAVSVFSASDTDPT